MNNDDERDYAEEAANAREMRAGDELVGYVPPTWVPPSEQLGVRALAASVYVVAAAVGLAQDPMLTFDQLGEDSIRAWEAIVRRVQLGTWCVDCLTLLGKPWFPVHMNYVDAKTGGTWSYSINSLADIHERRRAAGDHAHLLRFREANGSAIGMYATTTHDGSPVCEQHFRWRGQTQ